MGPAAVEDEEESVEDEDFAQEWLRAAIAVVTTSRPATRALRIRTRRVVVRAGAVQATRPSKATWRCQHVCDFRYADDMRRLVASERARIAR